MDLLFRSFFTAAVLIGLTSGTAKSEMAKVRVATQIGIAYLPLFIMQHEKLWEAKAKEAGIDLSVEYSTLGGGASLNDAVLSDSVQLASGGLAPLLVLWDRTRTNYKVKAVSAVSTFEVDLLTNDPKIKTVKDFGPDARIAVASIKVSYQAILLQMAAEQALGNWDALDNIQVSMAHPEAYAALTTHSGGVTGYMSSPPFQERALQKPGITKVTDSFVILGGPATATVIYGKSDFVTKNPKIVAAFIAAQKEAIALIKADLKGAINQYLEVTGDKTEPSLLESILKNKTSDFEIQPKRASILADFMAKIGLLKVKPASWKEYFFAPVADGQGS